MEHLSKIKLTSNGQFSIYKNEAVCFYCYLQNFTMKKIHFSKMIICKPNKNNTRQNLNLGKHRKYRKIEKIFSLLPPKLRKFYTFTKNAKKT